MAANTKYQPVAARDSFEESAAMPPPPSYQEESGVPGEARTEDDNIPDDFKVGQIPRIEVAADTMLTPVASSAAQSQKQPFRFACNSFAKSTPSLLSSCFSRLG